MDLHVLSHCIYPVLASHSQAIEPVVVGQCATFSRYAGQLITLLAQGVGAGSYQSPSG